MFHPCHVRLLHPQPHGCLLGLVTSTRVQHGWIMGWRSVGGVMGITREHLQETPRSVVLVGEKDLRAALRQARGFPCVLDIMDTAKSAAHPPQPPLHPSQPQVCLIVPHSLLCASHVSLTITLRKLQRITPAVSSHRIIPSSVGAVTTTPAPPHPLVSQQPSFP